MRRGAAYPIMSATCCGRTSAFLKIMASHPQGKGTVNVAINLLTEEKNVLGRLACADERSLGDFIRRLCITGLRVSHPEAAARLVHVRREHQQQLKF